MNSINPTLTYNIVLQKYKVNIILNLIFIFQEIYYIKMLIVLY